MDGEAGTTVADRSTAAVGVANESGEGPLAAQEGGATADGRATDDQTSSSATADTPTKEQTTVLTETAPTEPMPVLPPDLAPEAPTEVMAAATGPAGSTSPADAADGADRSGAAAAANAADAADAADAESDRDGGKATATAEADDTAQTAAEDAVQRPDTADEPETPEPATTSPAPAPAVELHSGHKLARRYQLEECVTRVDGFSSWRAVDEKLRRAVGVHVLPAGHPRARRVLSAARSAALLGDPRFVQVLDAVEENDLVYVIHEWLPDAASLADLLAAGPLEPHEAYQMVTQVSQGMAAAHREGLSHLRLDPGAVLRTASGQYRIRGLAVASALRGLSSDRPQRQDTEAIGALLYACLTQRWPYEEDAHGLAGLPKGVGLVAPDQVRAGVHRGLSELAMRALVNDGATASREEPPCTTPEELAKAVAGLPRIRPPEQPVPVYQPTVFHQPPAPPRSAVTRPPAPAPVPPPALPGRTGKALKWAVSALVIVAIGLGSWQLADALKSRGAHAATPNPTGQKAGQNPTTAPAPKPITHFALKDFDPQGDFSENPDRVPLANDGDPSTFWETKSYKSADLGNLKDGVGLIVDLGRARNISSVTVDLVGDTSVQLLAAPNSTTTAPTVADGYTKVAEGQGSTVTLKPSAKLTSRFVVVWLTRLPHDPGGDYRGEVSEIHVMG
jgi:hypothetical protein